jgi:hypothetical protein
MTNALLPVASEGRWRLTIRELLFATGGVSACLAVFHVWPILSVIIASATIGRFVAAHWLGWVYGPLSALVSIGLALFVILVGGLTLEHGMDVRIEKVQFAIVAIVIAMSFVMIGSLVGGIYARRFLANRRPANTE